MNEKRCSLPRAVVADVEFGVATGWIVVMGVTTAHKIRVTPNQLKERRKQRGTNKHERTHTHTDTEPTSAAWMSRILLRSIIGKASVQV
jgi:hypothetical protein